MIVLNSIVSTINAVFLVLMFFSWLSEETKSGRGAFTFVMFLLTVNTVLIWM